MTNIQAVEVLRDIKQSLKESMDETVEEQYKDSLLGNIIKAVFEEKYEALDMAIEALKSEPMTEQEYRKCVSCGNDRRIKEADGSITNVCTVDGHVIGYLECFGETCEKWCKDSKCDLK